MKNLSTESYHNLTQRIFSLQNSNDKDFLNLAIEVFNLQYTQNKVYQTFVDALGVKPNTVKELTDIPFLPIEIFKSQKVLTSVVENNTPTVFTSSGTTQTGTSYHYVNDIKLYEESFLKCFQLFFGKPEEYCVLALLPSYLERGGSSLVYMAQALINASNHLQSNFYLTNYADLIAAINELKTKKQKTLLLGVSYALLDLADEEVTLNENFIVMETGGMKGRRAEMLKEELHQILKEKLCVHTIFSEYGMTELLSQAYSLKDGAFAAPPWLRVLVRDVNDPFHFFPENKTGGVNVIDLANINSCCFIATQDLGKLNTNNTFELVGRFDNSDIRGCNLLVE